MEYLNGLIIWLNTFYQQRLYGQIYFLVILIDWIVLPEIHFIVKVIWRVIQEWFKPLKHNHFRNRERQRIVNGVWEYWKDHN